MKKLLLLSASFLLSVPMLAVAHDCKEGLDECAYWQQSSGGYVRYQGECVKSHHWFEGAQVPVECGGQVDDDGDGVDNADDHCPGTPAGYPVDQLGCATDSDWDGVADGADRCPGTASGVAVDEQGCSIDADMDGVVDADDACPGTPAGAEVDAKGCEKAVPVAGAVVMGVDLEVNFDSGSAQLAPDHRERIQEIADYMKQNPDTMVSIVGHTDSTGSAAFNKQLSQQRADAVADVLVADHGIEQSRVEAVGLGEEGPIADNATAAGREANRRVEAVVKAQ